MEEKVGKFFRLFPGNEVRLKGAYVVKCTGCVKDADGNVTEVLCEYDPASRGGDPADGRKVKSTIHWVEANEAVDAEVRLYSNLFTDPDPDAADKDFLECLNPDSLEILTGCKIERSARRSQGPGILSIHAPWLLLPGQQGLDAGAPGLQSLRQPTKGQL